MHTRDGIVAIIKNNLCSVLPYLSKEEVETARSLSDLGASSIDRAEIIIRTLEVLGLDLPLGLYLPLWTFVDVTNIGELARQIQEREAHHVVTR
jgi:polyketide biosynthesis acyl carrier protein